MSDPGNADRTLPYQAILQPPSATARDGDVILTVTVADPTLEERAGSIEIVLPLDFAKHTVVKLREAIVEALKTPKD
jgi:hypothetical protein